MDDLAGKGLIVPASRATFLGNRLVVVAPAGSRVRVPLRPGPLARLLSAGPLAMADIQSVPAGKYGKAALEKLGVWAAVSPHVVGADNVRSALALVERGVAPLGIVYATDAKASPKVRIAGVFPGDQPSADHLSARAAEGVDESGSGGGSGASSSRTRARRSSCATVSARGDDGLCHVEPLSC